MRNIKRTLSLIMVALLLLGLMTGCSSAPAASTQTDAPAAAEKPAAEQPAAEQAAAAAATDEPITITFTSWVFVEESVKATYQYMVDKYMELHPNVTIEVKSWPWAQCKDQMVMSVASGDTPDISHIECEWLPALYDLGALSDLNTVLSKDLLDDFYPSLLGNSTFDGQLAGVPFFTSPTAMWYNKTLLAEAGITELPTTWTEMMAAAEKIAALGSDADGNKIYGYCLPNEKASGGNGWNFFTHLWNHGADFCDENDNITILSPGSVEAFEEARKLYKDEISPNGIDMKGARNLFGQGRVGFYFDLAMAATVFTEASPKGAAFLDEVGVMCVPGQNDENGKTWASVHELVIYKDTEYPEVCADFIDFLTSEVCLQKLFDDGMGKMPSRASVSENMPCFASPADPYTAVFVKQLENALIPPSYQAHFAEADEAFADALAELTISNDDTETIVTNLDAKVKQIYGQ